jgi:hypothetical protein
VKFPDSRGSASVAALVLSAAGFLGGLWLAFGQRDAELGGKIQALREARESAPEGAGGRRLTDDADALYRWISDHRDPAPALEPFALRHVREEPGRLAPPGVTALEGERTGSHIVIKWSATGGETPEVYRVERLDEEGRALWTNDLPAGARTYRDGPVTELAGERTYRVTPIAHDGTVAEPVQKKVPFRVDFEVKFLGLDPDGSSRFRVTWWRGVEPISEKFAVRAGQEIGGPLPEREDRPALDWSTGWKFVSFRASRNVEVREVEVPVFSEDGKLTRDEESGQTVTELRPVPLAEFAEGVMVLRAGEEEMRWLSKAKD